MDEDEYNDFLAWVDFLQDADEERLRVLAVNKISRKKKSEDDE